MSQSRRRFLQSLAALPGAASLPACAQTPGRPRDVYQELGIRPLINAAGTYTYLSASLRPAEVAEAMESASRHFVNLNELHAAVGKRISALLGCEAALVTAGAASALLLGTAACVAGKDRDKIRRLPDTTGMKNEVLLPRAHRNGYDHAVRAAGVRLIEVETLADAERAVSERTAMLLYFNVHGPEGPIKVDEFAALARTKGIPALIDAAADIPPVDNYARFLKMGYDLAAFSGGKVLRGPQCSGFLLGRKDLVEAAAANDSPETDAIGRTNKVGKEEIVGAWAALEHFLKADSAERWRDWERRCATIVESLRGIRKLGVESFVPEIANAVPHLRLRWTREDLGTTAARVVAGLRDGEPRIEIRDSGEEWIEVAVWMLQPGEDAIVGRRLKELLRP
ncbi:MAG TPA: aminotransferase class V-fold PLP-dependent enzyme [Planctomycetota bacterium]|nr:aminotransferase class V-fold PLP-dependent enzyme [Planctomycetota bacterium]